MVAILGDAMLFFLLILIKIISKLGGYKTEGPHTHTLANTFVFWKNIQSKNPFKGDRHTSRSLVRISRFFFDIGVVGAGASSLISSGARAFCFVTGHRCTLYGTDVGSMNWMGSTGLDTGHKDPDVDTWARMAVMGTVAVRMAGHSI